MINLRVRLIGIVAVVALCPAAQANLAMKCESGEIDAYNSAVTNIGYPLKRYARCLESSDGSDDCSTEFRRLKYAQSEFESAVSNLGYCRY